MINIVKKNWSTITFTIVGPLLGIATGVIYWQFSNTPQPAYALALTLIITVVFHVGATTVLIASKTDEVKDSIHKTSKEFVSFQKTLLENRQKITSLDFDSAKNEIEKSIVEADTIKNTYINLSKNYNSDSKVGLAAVNLYNTFLSRSTDNTWIDITTYEDLNEGRYAKVGQKTDVIGNHEIVITDSSKDIINFTIAEKERSPFEVYFGWVSNSNDDYKIFYTKEAAFLDLFSDYFAVLRKRSVESFKVDYSKKATKIPSTTNKLLGSWLMLSNKDKPLENSDEFGAFSIMTIKIEDGAWYVGVNNYSRRPFRQTSKVESKHVLAYGKSVFYEYVKRTIIGELVEEGHGQYSIADFSEDIIVGAYMIPRKNWMEKTCAIRLPNDIDLNLRSEESWITTHIERLTSTNELGLVSNQTEAV